MSSNPSDHMKRSRLYKVLAAVILLCGVAAAPTFLGSFRFNPDEDSDGFYRSRATEIYLRNQSNARRSARVKASNASGKILPNMTFNPYGFRSKTERTSNSSFSRLQRIRTIIHLTRSLINSTARCLSQPTGRVTKHFSNIRWRASSHLTPPQLALCMVYSILGLNTLTL